MKKSFVIDMGVYPTQLFVCIGLTSKEIVRDLAKLHPEKWFLDFAKEQDQAFRDSVSDGKQMPRGMTMIHSSGAGIVWLKDWKNDDEHLGILVHELHHVVHMSLGILRSMLEEREAQAYAQEFLLKKILVKIRK